MTMNVSAKRGKGPRVTRAGIDQDTFPFHKLSVDGAKIAQSIISPLPDPNFAMSRAKDPLKEDMDLTNSLKTYSTKKSSTSFDSDDLGTISSSEISKPESKSKSTVSDKYSAEGSKSRRSEKDQYYDNLSSPEIQRKESYSVEDPGSFTYSTKFVEDPNYKHNGSQESVSNLQMKIPALKEHLDEKETEYTLRKTSKASLTTRSTLSSNPLSSPSPSGRSVDPEAKHMSGIFRRANIINPNLSDGPDSTSDSSYYEETLADSYYEVPDSPRATKCESFSDGETNSGWESGVGSSLNDTLHSPPKIGHSLSGSTGQPQRVGPDGTLHMSPKLRKEFLNHANLVKYPLSPAKTGGNDIGVVVNELGNRDPDGDIYNEDANSTHGEIMRPTPDESNNRSSFGNLSNDSQNLSSGRSNNAKSKSNSNHSKDNSSMVNNNESYESSSSSSSSSSEENVSMSNDESMEEVSLEESVESASTKRSVPHFNPFPSYHLLRFMSAMIALVVIGLIAGLTYYFWEKSSLDPLRPTGLEPEQPLAGASPVVPNGDDLASVVRVPSDQELLDLFTSVVGEKAQLMATSAGQASNWMLNVDPGKTLVARSNDAWIQRYLLVLTYFSTTFNLSTSWLSCNPPDSGDPNSSDECKFTLPTELPGGRVIYDLVPSHRWLSAADECQWGGVACSKTVIDEVDTNEPQAVGSTMWVTTSMRRLAVTSIVLADQYLKGVIVTELSILPELQILDLSHNDLKGTLSASFRSLETLKLQYNEIEGSIPANFFDDKSVMKELNIGSNYFTGTIPSDVGLASQITDLYLFNNQFVGTIPVLGNMPLINFQAQENAFTGIMPFNYYIGDTWPDTLREWWAYDNQLTGSLSDNIGFLTSLEDLRVNNNYFTGSIPESIVDLQRMFRFDVNANKLTGTVPEGIGDLPSLRDVRLQFNSLTGVVPTSLCYRESMELLEADCLASGVFNEEPQTDCFCCTTCCNPQLGQCQYY